MFKGEEGGRNEEFDNSKNRKYELVYERRGDTGTLTRNKKRGGCIIGIPKEKQRRPDEVLVHSSLDHKNSTKHAHTRKWISNPLHLLCAAVI
jgi:hypothetical protein